MIDLKEFEANFNEYKNRLKSRGVDEDILEQVRELFLKRKEIRKKFDILRNEQKQKSKEFAKYKKEGREEELKKELEIIKKRLFKLKEEEKEVEERLNNLALSIPNLPSEDTPIGVDESENIVIEKVGKPKEFSFKPKEHWEIANKIGLNQERGVKLAKSRFFVLENELAKLNRALINFCLEHNRSYGYKEVYLPFLVNEKMMFGTGQLPKFEEDLFKIENESLYLIPTAEVPLVNLFNDEIIDKELLPIKLTAYTPCFRREAGSSRRDTRGIIRLHQFDKVEIVAITKPEESEEIFEEMVEVASKILEKLNLPYRKVRLCTGDMGFSAAKTIDLEVWFPGQNKYREISSISNTYDFQARRAKIRFKDGKKNRLVHTLNGSSLAITRLLAAIIENYQTKDGGFEIPSILREYL